MESIKNRKTIRKYSNREVSNELLNRLLNEAARTQTMGNLQLYSVVVTRSAEGKEKLSPAHFNQPMVKNAPVVLPICAEMEAEIASLSKEEKTEFLADLGIEQGGLDLLIQRSYDLLGLMSFLTAGEPEVRAWTIKKGTKAPQAAGKIHSDIERGFIRAEVINYKLLLECGSTAAAREKGLIRSEGKEYIMQDGDVVLFRFNV